jgi:transmembrane sensor
MREEAAAWLARLRGTPTPAEQAAFEEWYSADAHHAAAYDAVLETWSLVGRVADSRERRGGSPSAARHPRRRLYVLGAAAATIAILCLAFAAFADGLMPRGADRAVEFASRAGEIRTIQLADGSKVILDAATLLETDYSTNERRTRLLKGRARFFVARKQTRPFIVATNAGQVIAHGTVFDVALTGPTTTVSLIEGSVEVRPAANDNGRAPSPSVRLAPGQQVVLDDGKIAAEPAEAARPGFDWPNSMLSFENAPLGEIVAAANRSGTGRIALASPSLANLRFTGTFKATNTQQLANLLAGMFGLDLRRSNDRTLVLLSPADTDAKKIPG